MLSLTTISPKQGEQYYRKENYYTEEEAQKNSVWWGKGADNLGLKGSIKGEEFTNLLYGKSPDGSFDLSGKAIDPKTRRAGIDLTFSAPKSVSIKGLVGGDLDLQEAHKKAVNQTLEVLQNRYSNTRISTPQGRKSFNTGNLIVAQFHHDTSRAKDPQLHTHCVAINAVQLPNGQWRSLSNEEIYSNKMLLGQIYRNNLAREIEKLGYEIDRQKNGLFEIKGYTKEQLETFSKRSIQIKEAAGENASSKEKEYAALTTRIAKDKAVNRDYLLKYWQEEAKIKNVVHPKPDKLQKKSYKKDNVAVAINRAITHCSERNVNFKRSDLEKFVLSEVGQYSWDKVQAALNSKEKTLLKAKKGEKTTTKALIKELDTIRIVQDNKNSVSPIADRDSISTRLQNTSLTEGQRNAIATAATTSDRFIAWQGKAGVGKTYALNKFKEIAERKGYEIKGFAPSAEAAKTLGNELGIGTNTVAGLLYSKKDPKESSRNNRVWIVDEAGLLNAKDAHSLIRKATEEKARVILVGDTRQLSGVEAGNPFKSLQKAGIETAYLNESLRQKTGDLKLAVDLISEGQTKKGIQILESNDRLIKLKPDQTNTRITQDYLNLSPQERKNTLILAGTNAEREAITDSIRSALKVEGILGREAKIAKLRTKDLTSAQKQYSHNYQKGDVIMPLRDYKSLNLNKGELYTVKSKTQDRISIADSSGKILDLDPAKFKNKAVFDSSQIQIAEGDRLRWTKNDRDNNRRNGQQFTLSKLNGSTGIIKYDSGETEEIDLNSPQHLDHALVSTTYSSQGKTADRVLVSANNDRTLNQESFYVAASRAKYNLTIYTEDKENLIKKSQQTAAKKNPSEVIETLDKQHELAKNNLKEFLARQKEEIEKIKKEEKEEHILSKVNQPEKSDNKRGNINKESSIVSDNEEEINLEVEEIKNDPSYTIRRTR